MSRTKCYGVRTSWPWKGYPCGAEAKYTVDGLTYCANHASLAQKECGRIVKKDTIPNPDSTSTAVSKGEFEG
jgi:hypothetical protein